MIKISLCVHLGVHPFTSLNVINAGMTYFWKKKFAGHFFASGTTFCHKFMAWAQGVGTCGHHRDDGRGDGHDDGHHHGHDCRGHSWGRHSLVCWSPCHYMAPSSCRSGSLSSHSLVSYAWVGPDRWYVLS